jgi:putative ABC transport system ATP-binding protein
MTVAVEARLLKKSFDHGETQVLKGVHLDVFQGECLMLVGPSGSGKTTLLSILGCVLRPDSGTVSLFGNQVSDLSERELPAVRRANIGFAFQGHNLIASLTAEENVVFQLNMRGIGGAKALFAARDLLERVGLTAHRDTMPKALSGGQRQRVAVARALAGKPPIVLADEPTASLDIESGRQVMELFKSLSKESDATLIIVTHDARIFDYADRIEHLENGKMVRNEDASISSFMPTKFWTVPEEPAS